MTNLTTIPKYVPPRIESTDQQMIPKIIWQTMKTNCIPVSMKGFCMSWIDKNPEYEYRFFDDNDMVNFISEEFPEYFEGFKKILYGASKADLWRYLILYKYGGVYADIDCKCNRPLKEWVNPDAKYVTQLGTNRDVCQWLIITVPKNEVLLRAAQKTLLNLQKGTCRAEYKGFSLLNDKLTINEGPAIKVNHQVMGLGGPPILQEAAEECLCDDSCSHIFEFTQVVCTSGKKSCQMNGHVTHDYGNTNYLEGLKQLGTRHYKHHYKEHPILLKSLAKKCLHKITGIHVWIAKTARFFKQK